MNDSFKIKWEAADGYVGKSRPQSFSISAEDVRFSGSLEQAVKLMEDMLFDDFQQKITPEVLNEDDFSEWARAILDGDAS
jgi:hypothetical protein